MSLYGAMFSGVSALNAQSQALGMISDNISNVNTVGYKTTNAAFSTLVTRSTANFHAPGGVRSTPQQAVDRQGLLQSSASPTDLAISGDGFFVVAETSAPTATDSRLFTRAGQFSTDENGFLRTPSGNYLQGWATDSAGVPTATAPTVMSSLTSVKVSSTSGSATPTTTIDLGLNLPATATLPASVANNSIQTTVVQIFDSLGVAHDVTFTWTKTATNAWTVTASGAGANAPTAGRETTPLVGATPYSVDVVFNSDGTPATFDGGATPPALVFDGWTSGAGTSTLAMNFGTANTSTGITQFAGTYSVGFANQNGVQFGNFFGVTVDEAGIVSALFDNGQTLKVYKLPVATFPNPNGLSSKSGTAFAESQQSGGFFLRAAKEANAGSVVSSALEASTSDLANEFTNMIITQRAYSAATRSITTADNMLEELLRVGR